MKGSKIIWISILLPVLIAVKKVKAGKARPVVYYVDSRQGDDTHNGRDKQAPWKSIGPLQLTSLHPGDSICFKRGSSFTGPFTIPWSGSPGHYITITDYGTASDPAPAITNPVFAAGNYGNGIRVGGSYVIVENLYFHQMAAYDSVEYHGEGWVVWEMGAIHIDSGARHCIIRNNEIEDCVAGIRSNGEYALITHNYIHDCNRVLKQWNWGPLGIWLGADHQEVCYNKIFNYSAVDPHIGWGPNSYGSGADGGALEIDDARYDKSDISIHHNYTRDNQGFLEVTWTDVKKNPHYSNFQIHHNISDDFQQFIALWRGEGCRIEDNTIIRRQVNANEWGVFNITQNHSHNVVRRNTIITGKAVVIFNTGRKGAAQPETLISHNAYYTDGDSLHMGKEGPGDAAIYTASRLPLAMNGRALVNISLPAGASPTGQFAAGELSRYLYRMSGAAFTVKATTRQPVSRQSASGPSSARAAGTGPSAVSPSASSTGTSIRLEVDRQLPTEDYSISLQYNNLVLSGGSERAVLYAVYDLLHRLGCEWLAPAFDFYKGRSEFIPKITTLEYVADGPVIEHPRLAYRKLDVEEGRTHTFANLRQMIEWMPKVRLNVFMVPLNYQGAGRVQWDHWRTVLTPELKKRGLLIEVGGHGYQNFIKAKMEGGTLFSRHPEWFGKNKRGQPDTTDNLVFNTSDPEAVQYFLTNIQRYLRQHPEIDIFDCWPPDVAKWAECPEMTALGAPADRQARLMNQVDSAVALVRPGVRVEIIAYGQVLQPPQKVVLNKNILVDICPINQSFEKPIQDTTNPVNIEYAKAILDWRQYFPGNIGLYSYYRKYAWRSVPVILPHYMQRELLWYAGLRFQAVSTYAEPGDWFTYEANHYTLAALAWNPRVRVDSILDRYAGIRFGPAKQIALAACRDLEEEVRTFGSLPYTSLKAVEAIEKAATLLRARREQVDSVWRGSQDKEFAANLNRLSNMLEYAIRDLGITKMRASGIPVDEKVKELVDFLEHHRDEGLFILSNKNNFTTFSKHYNSLR